MSNKKLDKGKLYHKLHQLQKKLYYWITRSEQHDESDEKIVKSRERTLLEKIKGKNKSTDE
jgi:hypothetical protein